MQTVSLRTTNRRPRIAGRQSLFALSLIAASVAAQAAQTDTNQFKPGNLVVSRSVYDNLSSNV